MLNLDELSDIGIGTWSLGESLMGGELHPETIFEKSFAGGINHIDTSPTYHFGRAERRIGRYLQQMEGKNPQDNGHSKKSREEIFLATKCGVKKGAYGELKPNDRPAAIRKSLEKSLESLNTNILDLYYFDPTDHKVPIEQVMQVLSGLKEEGLIRFIGLNGFKLDQLKHAIDYGEVDVVRTPFNLFERHSKSTLLEFCQDQDIKVMAYRVLCWGLLTDEYLDKEDPSRDFSEDYSREIAEHYFDFLALSKKLRKYFKNRGRSESFASLMMAWVIHHPGVDSVLAGAHSLTHIEHNLKAKQVRLTESEIQEIDEIYLEQLAGEDGPFPHLDEDVFLT